MSALTWIALGASLGLLVVPGLAFIGVLALVLSQLDRRRYVRRLHRMRRG